MWYVVRTMMLSGLNTNEIPYLDSTTKTFHEKQFLKTMQ